MAPVVFGDHDAWPSLPEPRATIAVTDFADYVAKLRAAHVILDPAERKPDHPRRRAQSSAAKPQVTLRDDEGLLDEVTGLVEWPVPLLGTIDAQFMDVPPEVLIVSMKVHLRHLHDDQGRRCAGQPLRRRRQQRGARPRQDDRRRATSASCARGSPTPSSSGTRTARLRLEEPAAGAQAGRVPRQSSAPRPSGSSASWQAGHRDRQSRSPVPTLSDDVEQAARLCKSDLVTGMVGEFPELQGVMGRYYALGEKLPAAVADAIGDHYTPAGPNDRCPTCAGIDRRRAGRQARCAGPPSGRSAKSPRARAIPLRCAARRSASSASWSRTGCACRCKPFVRRRRPARLLRRPPQGADARKGRTARRGRRRRVAGWRGRSRPAVGAGRSAAGLPRHRRRPQSAHRLRPRRQHRPRRREEGQGACGEEAGKWVYTFGDGKAEGQATLRDLLGGKGANLAEMANLGLPVPPGFTIPTSVCTYFYDHDKTYPKELKAQVEKALDYVGKLTGKTFGDARNPLLVSVRSGARASMPGMMDTVLNLGLNDQTVEALAELSGDRRFAYDSYRRFITMYSDVVLGFEHHHFEDILDTFKDGQGYSLDTDLTGDDWVELVGKYKEAVAKETGHDFPQDPHEQLWGAIGAVFSSWMNARAVTYRKLHDIPESWGTAVNVQAMVFGNMGETSATGVAFTRNPSTGESKLYGEFLINAQGEDVVAGIRTPQDITEEARQESGSDKLSMEAAMPAAFKELTRIYTLLEKHYRDMQDMEFTVEQGKLWMLQTRGGKRTAKAALRIAVELANEGLISRKDAVTRIDPASLDQLLHPTIDPAAKRDVIATGLPASPGAASGEIVFSSDEAAKLQADGRKVILVRIETSPEDIHGMHAAEGILTTRGGMTSHAAVVARGMGKPCVSGCGTIRVDYGRGTMSVGQRTFKTGDVITHRRLGRSGAGRRRADDRARTQRRLRHS
jgi:phosphohistidine swiveling domain-containing protein